MSRFDFFPTIFAELDEGGNTISQKRGANFSPKVETLNSGAIVFGSWASVDSTGEFVLQSVITKTDTNGDVEGCQTYLSCLKSENVVLGSSDISFEEITASGWVDIEMNVVPMVIFISKNVFFC